MSDLGTADLLWLGGAAVAGFFILKGAKQVVDYPQKAAVKLTVDAYNAVAGLTNQAGLSNTQAVINAWNPSEYGVMTDTHQNPTLGDQAAVAALKLLYGPSVYVGINEYGTGYTVMGSGVQVGASSDWIPGLHLW